MNHSHPVPRSRLAPLVLCLAALACAACQPTKRVAEHVTARRLQSRVECPPAQKRSLETHCDQLVLVSKPHRKSPTEFTISDSGGAAFRISEDGYYLTAAHCVSGKIGGLTPLWSRAPGSMRLEFASIVWKPESADQPDVAILRGSPRGRPFALVDPASLRVGAPVANLGFAERTGEIGGSPWATFGRGNILEISPLLVSRNGARTYKIVHDAPCWFGDSGGPLLTEAGRVAGLNSGMRWLDVAALWQKSKAIAILPDPRWIQEVIQKDRERPRSRRPSVLSVRHPPSISRAASLAP